MLSRLTTTTTTTTIIMTLAASLLSPVANAHFTLTTPAPIGTDIGGERATPCGGFDPCMYY